MACNKDEAIWAKAIAERKIDEKDYIDAKKFALKAQKLFPALDGLSQLLTTLDVYVSAENRIRGEVDCYGILGVNSWADDETVKKQYRKLALTLHPDKNKSKGADGAFKLVSEAWSLLSDTEKRLAYNQRRNSMEFQQKVVPSKPTGANGFKRFTKKVSSHKSNQNNNTRVASSSSPAYQKTNTFWTICSRCKTHYEYLKIYLNHTLLCPNCNEAFYASEKAPPPNVSKSSFPSSHQQHEKLRHRTSNSVSYNSGSGSGGSAGLNSLNNTNFQSGLYSGTAGFGSTISSSYTAGQAANLVQQANGKVKRDCKEGEGSTWEDHAYQKMGNSVFKAERRVKRKTDDISKRVYGGDTANQMAMGNRGVDLRSVSRLRNGDFEREKVYGSDGISSKNYNLRELSWFEIRKMLMEKARTEIRNRVKKWSSIPKTNTVEKEKEQRKQRGAANGVVHRESAGVHRRRQKKSLPDNSANSTGNEAPATISMNVPDPDFHNFDLERNEKSFGDDQVWAAYDAEDGMPRYYARIHKVISLKPFRMRISWLNSRTNSEFGPLDWVGSGFLKTCGVFRTGRHENSGRLNSFSHKVNWIKGDRGVIHIFPREGDIWALYRNWSPDWNDHTPAEVVHIYDMVEVLSDYNEKQGVLVTPLVKVPGFRTLFHKHMDPKEVRRIPKEEMFRFSHQVPNYLLSGQEAPNAPKGCRELDPAATPLELLQVITEGNEKSAAGDSRMQGVGNIMVEEMAENASQVQVTDGRE